jgi:hypothetical protein
MVQIDEKSGAKRRFFGYFIKIKKNRFFRERRRFALGRFQYRRGSGEIELLCQEQKAYPSEARDLRQRFKLQQI